MLDLILIALAAAFAVAGYRQGFIVGVLSFVGFLGGAALGAALSPRIAQLVEGPGPQALVAIVVVFLGAVIGQLIASLVGAAVRSRVTWRPAALVDAVGGAGVSVVSVLLIAWLIGSAVANTPLPTVSGMVRGSAVLRGLDRFMPPAAHTMFSSFHQFLSSGPYPQVFAGLAPDGSLTVGPVHPSVVHAAALARDKPSIVKVKGWAPQCRQRLEGSGFVIAPEHVLTNAHVVAGVTGGPVVAQGQRAPLAAHVVLYDPQRDVAVLYVPGLTAPPLRFAGDAPRGSDAIVAGYPQDHGFTAVAARVDVEQSANTVDIYDTHYVTRQIYRIRALVQPGNSGGPLLARGGSVYGVVFAAALNRENTGYVLTAGEVASDARTGAKATVPVSTQACTRPGG